MATYDDYYKKARKAGLLQAETLKADRDKADDASIEQYGEAVDSATDKTVGIYNRRIEGADDAYRGQYGESAVAEQMTRRQIKQSMAAAGMTDSGQNLTMQAATAMQRGNRDAAITTEKRNYVQKLQDSIDAVRAEAEAKKRENELSVRQSTRDWYDSLLSSVDSTAQETASKLYAADQEAESEKQKQKSEKQKQKTENKKWLQEQNAAREKNRADYALNLIKNTNMTEEEAWASAYKIYPAEGGYTQEEREVYEAAGGGEAGELAVAQNAARVGASFADSVNVNAAAIFMKSLWTNGSIPQAIANAVTDATSKSVQYMGMSEQQKSATLALLVAKMVKAVSSSTTRTVDATQTLTSVCSILGINQEDAEAAYGLF